MPDSAILRTIAHQALLSRILQTRILEWVAMPSSSQPRDKARVSFPLSRGKGTPVTGQGVMKRKWGTLLGLLCIQICCESGSSQRGDWGGSTVDSEREGRRADLGLLDGPTSSGVSWYSLQVWKLHPWLPSDIICVCFSLFPSRGEGSEGGVESFSLEPPRGSQLYSVVQFFCCSEQCAVVPAESQRQPHQSVFHSFRDEAEWKTEFHSEF